MTLSELTFSHSPHVHHISCYWPQCGAWNVHLTLFTLTLFFFPIYCIRFKSLIVILKLTSHFMFVHIYMKKFLHAVLSNCDTDLMVSFIKKGQGQREPKCHDNISIWFVWNFFHWITQKTFYLEYSKTMWHLF